MLNTPSCEFKISGVFVVKKQVIFRIIKCLMILAKRRLQFKQRILFMSISIRA
jgi:hypothetical protein